MAANGENISGETKDKELVIIDKPSQKNAKKSRAFTDQETSLLISEWYKYPQLYDKQTQEYHDRDKQVLAKENIALSLNEALGYDDEDEKKITAADVQKKIENLRTYFAREYGKENEVKPKSGSGQIPSFKSSWPWYKQLSWLKHQVTYKDSLSNLTSPSFSSFSCEIIGGEVLTKQEKAEESVRPARKRAKTNKNEDRLIRAAEEMVSKFPTFQPSQPPVQTDDELFGQLVAKKMSKIPEGDEKEELKLNIQLLIKQAMYPASSLGKMPFCSNLLSFSGLQN